MNGLDSSALKEFPQVISMRQLFPSPRLSFGLHFLGFGVNSESNSGRLLFRVILGGGSSILTRSLVEWDFIDR
uniref:Uncharacterized protein n=1 Tax=Lepeophtheirus salmonis TaxID=72036 RepID=A0A0K2V0W8_LEPSM